jgi:hypothetical protein
LCDGAPMCDCFSVTSKFSLSSRPWPILPPHKNFPPPPPRVCWKQTKRKTQLLIIFSLPPTRVQRVVRKKKITNTNKTTHKNHRSVRC